MAEVFGEVHVVDLLHMDSRQEPEHIAIVIAVGSNDKYRVQAAQSFNDVSSAIRYLQSLAPTLENAALNYSFR